MSQIRMQTQVPGGRQDSRFSMDPMLTEEIRQVRVTLETAVRTLGLSSHALWRSLIVSSGDLSTTYHVACSLLDKLGHDTLYS